MSKINFDFDIDDVKDFLGIKRKKIEENKNNKNDYNKNKNEEDIELTSYDTQAELKQKKLRQRFFILLVVAPILIMLTKVIIETIWDIRSANRQTPAVKEKKEDFDNLKINKDFSWRVLTDESIENLNKKVSSIETNVKKELNATVNIIKDELKKNNKHIQKVVESIKEENKEFQNSIEEFTISQISKLDEKLEKKIKEIETNQSAKISAISLENLPKLKTPDSFEEEKKKLEEEAKKKLPPIKDENKTEPQKEEETELAYSNVELDGDIDDSYVIEEINASQEENKTKKYPTFTLMPGFVKGVLVNGSRVNAFLTGDSEPAPIYIRLIGRELIPNDDSINIDGCLILATAKSDLSKQTVDIRLSKMTCSLMDIDGNRYKMETNVQGWVFSENGEFGLPGRLITRESKILKAGIPLSILQGMINTLSNVLNKQYTDTVGGGNYYIMNPGQSMAQGAGEGTQVILKKFTDYYLKMLNALNPVIEVRAGRKVTVAFKGGEQLKIVPYKGINTEYFIDQADEEDIK